MITHYLKLRITISDSDIKSAALCGSLEGRLTWKTHNGDWITGPPNCEACILMVFAGCEYDEKYPHNRMQYFNQ